MCAKSVLEGTKISIYRAGEEKDVSLPRKENQASQRKRHLCRAWKIWYDLGVLEIAGICIQVEGQQEERPGGPNIPEEVQGRNGIIQLYGSSTGFMNESCTK